MGDVTAILRALEQGKGATTEELVPIVYHELRQLAARHLARERPGQTLQTTALVHEAYVRLVDVEKAERWNSRGHFFAAAAEAMRRILVENARRKKRLKRGGASKRVDIEVGDLPAPLTPETLLALDDALGELAKEDPVKARLVTARFFGGMAVDQAAEVLGISRVTAFRYWTYARAWLHDRLQDGRDRDGAPPAATSHEES
jgi:RNA polymerase sigma factor (TIGR02999 family)